MTNPFLGNDLRQSTPAPANPFSGNQPRQPDIQPELEVVTGQARTANPERTAQSLTLSRRTGLPADVVERNFDEVAKLAGDRTFEPGQFASEFPVTARWLTNPTNAAVAKDDYENLGYLERIVGRWESPRMRGILEGLAGGPTRAYRALPMRVQAGLVEDSYRQGMTGIELARIYANTTPTQRQNPEIRARIDALRGELRELPEAEGIAERVFRSAAGGFLPSMQAIATEAGIGAAGGAISAGIIGQAGPQVALPEEVFTVPLGAAIGATASAFNEARQLWSGELARNLDEIRDANGQPLSPAVQETVKHTFGVLGGAFEVAGLGVVGRQMAKAVGTRAVAAGVERGMANALERQTIGRVATEAGKVHATTVAVETAEETLSDILSVTGEAVAREIGNLQGGNFGPVENVTERLVATAVETFYGSLALGGFAAGGVSLVGLAQVAQANAEAERFAAMVGVADASKLRGRDPESFRQVVEEQMRASGMPETVGVPADRAVILLQENNVPLEQFAAQAGVSVEAIRDAVAAGQDVMLPVANILANLTQTPVFQAMQEDIRYRVGLPTLREAKQAETDALAEMDAVRKEMEQAVAETPEGSVQKIVDDIVAQVTTAGVPKGAQYTPENVQAMAQGIAAFYKVVGGRQGIDPYGLYRSRNYRILGPQQAEMMLASAEGAMAQANPNTMTLKEIEEYYAVDAHELMASLGPDITAEEIADIQLNPVSFVRRALAAPKPDLSADEMARRALRVGFAPQPDILRQEAQMPSDGAMPETLDVDGVQRPTRNSEGRPIHPTEEGVRNFWRWATEGGREPLADDTGRPIVVYHGTKDASFDEFNPLAGKFKTANTGAFLTTNPAAADTYAGVGGALYPLYVRTRNNVEMNAQGRGWERLPSTAPVSTPEGVTRISEFADDDTFTTDDLARYARSIGADAVIVANVIDRGPKGVFATPKSIDPSTLVVVFDGADIKSAIGNSGEFGPTANILRQGVADPNAFIVPGVSQTTIGLMRTANLSSVLHEFSHDWLLILRDEAMREDASEQVRADWQTATQFLGITDAAAISVAAQEKWARSFERYLATAEAPSRGLARAFVRFRSWMASVYRQVREMLLPVSDDIAGVFDRILATEDELRVTRMRNGAAPIIATEADAEKLGMTPEQYRDYAKGWALDNAEQNAALLKDLLAERSDEFRKVKREAESRIREDVTQEFAAIPIYQAIRYLTTGEIPPGIQMVGGEKLNREAVQVAFGADITKSLPRGIFTDEGGIDADALALAFGFRDGFAVIEAMQQAVPEKQAIAAEVRRRLAEQFPDPMQNSAVLTARAQDVAHKASTDDPIVRDLTLLAKASGIRPPNVPAIKAVAREMVSQMRVQDIRPVAYQNAEATAARKSGEAFKAGNLEQAAFHKRQQLLNHILYREARKAVERTEVIARYGRKLEQPASQQRLGRAGQDYLNAVNAVLDTYEFRRVSGALIQLRAAIDAFIRRSTDENGVPPAIPQSVLDDARTINYRQLTVAELDAVYDTLKQIDHFASLKGKLLKAAKQRTVEQAAQAIVGSIAEHHTIETRPPDYAPSRFKRLVDAVKKWDAWHVKPEFLFRWLDGENPQGATHELLFQPIADAQNAETVMLKEAVPAIRALFDRIPKALRKRMDEKLTGPNIPQGYTREQAIALALNWGNESNREAVRLGQIANGQPHLTDANIRALLNVLTADEWAFVQGVWDYIDSFWPEISALQQRIVGVAPEKIGRDAFTWRTPDGTEVSLQGGYYPLSYDRQMSWSQRRAEAEGTVQEMAGGGFTRQLTKHGFTEERVGSGGKPVNLRLSVFPQHVINVIHDLTHREAIIDVRKLAERRDVREAIIGTAGNALYDSINPWLNRVAAEQTPPASPWEDLLGRARVGATMVNMGFKVTTAVTQPLGLLQTVDVLGLKYTRRGVQEVLKSPKAITEQVLEWSPELRARRTQFDRDVKDAVDSFALKGWSPEVAQTAFWMTGTADMLVAVPTFYGAYLKSMETINVGDHEASVKYAESVVRQSQSAGGAKDLAQIQGGPESRRIFTMFYSYFSVLYNLFRRSGSLLAQRGVSDLPRFAGSMAVLWFLPAVLGELVAGRGPEDDEDYQAWLLEQTARYPFASVVGVRDVAGGVASKLSQGRAFYDISPVVSAFESGIEAVGGLAEVGVQDEPMSRAEWKAMVESVGYWFKLPSRQMWITGEALYDWMMGYDSPEGPLDAARDLAFPRPR